MEMERLKVHSQAPQNLATEKAEVLPLPMMDLGLIEYERGLDYQTRLLDQVAHLQSRGMVLFCSHPAIVTLGRKSEPSDYAGWKGQVIEVSRGGRATYHGPNQLVIYPLMNLQLAGPKRPAKDIAIYLRGLEHVIIDALGKIGIQAQSRPESRDSFDPTANFTGVWVGNRKIASIGIAVRKWVTYHGAAINVTNDPTAFQGMRPCGFSPSIMTSVEEQLGKSFDRQQLQALIYQGLQNL